MPCSIVVYATPNLDGRNVLPAPPSAVDLPVTVLPEAAVEFADAEAFASPPSPASPEAPAGFGPPFA